MAESISQKEANRKWKSRNRLKQNIYNDRSKAKKFIRNEASIKDAKELIKLSKKRIKVLTLK